MSSRREVGRGRSCENVSLYSETAKEGHNQTQTENRGSICPRLVCQGISLMLKRPRGNRKDKVGLPALRQEMEVMVWENGRQGGSLVVSQQNFDSPVVRGGRG